jgi:MoaA/NifB/PqqE/SkfB family radical SAM enzyme
MNGAGRVHREAYDQSKCCDIVLNYACQARCRFCSQDFEWRKSPNLMPFKLVAEKMYLAYRDGYRRLGFTGGEPTLRKDLGKLIALATRIGFHYVRIQTNGLRLADEAYARELAEAGLAFVKFSIHGHDAETHDALTLVPGSFDACVKAAENLKRARVGAGVNIVLNSLNYRRLEGLFELLLLRLKLSDFVIIAPIYEGNMQLHAAEMGVRLSDAAPHVREVYRLFSRAGFPKPPLLLHFTPCLLPGYEEQMLGWSAFNTMVISPAGEEQDLDEAAAKQTVKAPGCAECVYNDRCIGLDRTYADRFGLAELVPLKEVPARYEAADAGSRELLTDNERCVLVVLKDQDGLSTEAFLKSASRYGICKNCQDQNAVLSAAETLVRMGLVERRFEKGRYVWGLLEAGRARA